jgi:hypothetical protein
MVRGDDFALCVEYRRRDGADRFFLFATIDRVAFEQKRPYDRTSVEGALTVGTSTSSADHAVFASGCPFDKRGGAYIRDTSNSLGVFGNRP